MRRFLFLFISVCSTAFSLTTQDLTLEWLFTKDGADYLPHFHRIFKKMKVRTMIQCSANLSTQYFIDHCDHVLNLELMHPGVSNNLYTDCFNLFKKSTKWSTFSFNSDFNNLNFNKACDYQCATHKDYSLIDNKYLEDLDAFFKTSIQFINRKKSAVDVAFVKTYGIYVRGDLVNLFLKNKVPVVVAHDTNSDIGDGVSEGLYGWFKIHTPPEYEKIYIPFVSGTTCWISKEYPELIDSMKRYSDTLMKMQSVGILTYDPELLMAIAGLP